MDCLTFISKLIDSLVWPAVTLLIVYWLKDAIAQRLKGLKKLKWGDKEAEFGELLDETKAVAIQEDMKRTTIETKASVVGAPWKRLLVAAEHTPQGAIAEAWLHVEVAASDLFTRLHPGEEIRKGSIMSLHEMMRRLLEEQKIDVSLYTMFQNLRKLRNIAVHNDRKPASVEEAREYVNLARIVVADLNTLAGKPN